jgi:hypothetical protein
MRGATAKALLCHSADDITQWGEVDITGPDVKTGYGAVNLENAAALIQKDIRENNVIVEFELNQNETKTLYFQVLDKGTLSATLSWYDPHADKNATNTLVNDLDLRIIQDATIYYPWKLPTDTQQVIAVLGDNSTDNLEQIKTDVNLGGVYKVEVSHKGALSNGSQEASLIISGPGISITTVQELESFSKDGFLVSPIPVKAFLTISALKNNLPFRSVRLLNLQGIEVAITKKSSFTLNSVRFEVGFLSSGSYILAIETKGGNIYKKILVNQ